MSIDDWSDMMVQTVDIEPFVTKDKYHKAVYGTLVSYSARVVNKNVRVRSSDGEEVVSSTHAWLATTDTIDPEDRATLPDDSQPKILSIDQYPDENGNHHTKVFFQ